MTDEQRAEAVARIAEQYQRAFPDVPGMTVSEFQAQPRSVTLLDVRPLAEQQVARLPGAQSLATWTPNADNSNQKIVLYCTAGYRSAAAARQLRERGFPAYNLIGGVLAWAHANGTFVDIQNRPTQTVHVYGQQWDLLPTGYTSVWESPPAE